MSNDKVKVLTLRVPFEIWSFFKKLGIDKNKSMHEMILNYLIKEKEKSDKKS